MSWRWGSIISSSRQEEEGEDKEEETHVFFSHARFRKKQKQKKLKTDYPTEEDFPNFRKNYAPRGVLHCKDGKITDTGPLTKKRMETIDDECLEKAIDFMTRAKDAGEPFFVWFNATHMHFRTHAKPEELGQAGRWQSPYHDVMVSHSRLVGKLLKFLDDSGLFENTVSGFFCFFQEFFF